MTIVLLIILLQIQLPGPELLVDNLAGSHSPAADGGRVQNGRREQVERFFLLKFSQPAGWN